MRKRVLYTLLILGLLGVVAGIPLGHIFLTWLREDSAISTVPHGYIDDASKLNKTRIDTIVCASAKPDSLVQQLREIITIAKRTGRKISISGARHSMGGHIMYPAGIVVDMRPYNHMEIDTATNILTIGSGALWSEAIEFLEPHKRSLAVVQAFSAFSIGGSISVNGHGWQHNSAPIASSVVSFTLLKSDLSIVQCSREENSDLFRLVVGGYGLFGIILDVKIKVVNNENLHFAMYKLPAGKYLEYYTRYADSSATTRLAFGRLNISRKSFLEEATLNIFTLAEDQSRIEPLDEEITATEEKRLIFRSTVNSEYGKRLRWNLETHLSQFLSSDVYSRNQVLNEDVSLIENRDSTSTDILQEYFIPRRNFYGFIAGLKKILPGSKADLLNITIRNVYKDNDSFMAYAREEVFGFVMLFNQKKTAAAEADMQQLTGQLLALTREMEGTYYLPYRLHADREMFLSMYPQAEQFFVLKKLHDPDEVFQNKFYTRYR